MKVVSTPYEDIQIGARATYQRQITEGDVRAFATLSGDTNPLHLDDRFARTTPFDGRIVHGALLGAHLSAALATQLPGPGTVYLEERLRFRRPVRIGDTVTTELEVIEKREDKRFVRLKVEISTEAGGQVASGEALVMPPPERIELDLVDRA